MAILLPVLDTTTCLKTPWGAGVTRPARLAAVGVNEEGFREVLAIEVAGEECSLRLPFAWAIGPDLSGVQLVSKTSAATVATEIALRSSEELALERYLTLDVLGASEKTKPTAFEMLTVVG